MAKVFHIKSQFAISRFAITEKIASHLFMTFAAASSCKAKRGQILLFCFFLSSANGE
jgi:hypothetical protein